MLTLCRLILKLYPASFRSAVGDSMLQTVRDSLAGSAVSDKVGLVVGLTLGAAVENLRQLEEEKMAEKIFSRSGFHVLGFLLIVPGAIMLTLLILGVEPPFGPFEQFLKSDGVLSKWTGTFLVLGTIVILPLVGVLIATRGESKLLVSSALTSAAIALLLIAPFVALQFIYGRVSYTGFPLGLFLLLWMLPAIAIFVALPAAARFGFNRGKDVSPISLALRLAAAIPIAIMWFALLKDQIPCFLGVPNCD